MRNLQRCLYPASIAVIGGREAEQVIMQCQKMGFSGDIWPVNARRSQLAGIDCYTSITDLPDAPDIVFIAIPAAPTVICVSELASMGAGGVVCYASGFREVGDTDLHEQLLDAAGEMPVIGPNCYGYINALIGAALWPDQHGLSGCDKGVAIFSSSGNVSVNFTMQQRSLDIALIVSVGNQAMVGIEHCIDAVLDDPNITAIGIHIEGLSYLGLFIELCRKAALRNKPVIALKTGRSNAGARITMSHTATLAGEAALYDHLFLRTGVGQVHDVEAFLEALKLVSIVGPIRGDKIASMSCSGGEASLIADLSEHRSISFPPLSADHKASVQQTLNKFVSVDNPLDYHTFIWGDKARMFNTFCAMLRGDFDLTLLLLDYPCVNDCDMSDWISAGEAFAEACAATEKKGAIVASMAESMSHDVRESLIAAGIAPMMGIQSAINAIEAVSTVCCIVEPLPIVHPAVVDLISSNGKSVSEYNAKQQLAAYGLAVAKGEIANSVQEAVNVAEKIGFPVALKVSSSDISHKSEIDGVVLNLQSKKDVEAQCERLLSLTGSVLVEEMLSPGVAEVLLGVSVDSQFGHYIVIGFGGTLVELIADRAIVLLPASDQQIMEAIEKLRVYALLNGFRDKPPGDLDALVRCVQQLASFVDGHRAQLLEVDINPLIVAPIGCGAVAADALLIFKNPETPNH